MSSFENPGISESAETSHRPASLKELQSERSIFIVLFVGIVAITFGLVMLSDMIGSAAEGAVGTLMPLVMIVSRLGISSLVAAFAMRLGMREMWRIALLAALAFLPIGGWIAVCLLLDFCPEHIETGCRSTMPRQTRLILTISIGGFPIALALFLTIISPDYMGQLIFGSERGGASIPGIGIPCGWPLLFVALASTALGMSSLRTMLRNRFSIAPSLILILMTLAAMAIACYLFLLGPAIVQMYEIVSSGALDF
jgi:hypothetical protein